MTTRTCGISSAPNWRITLVLLAAFHVLSPIALWAGEAPKIQFFGGYSRMQFDSKALGFSSNTGLNGGTASAAFNLTPYFGGVGEIGIESGPNIRSRAWLLGPQVMYNKWKLLFFGHILFGKAETRVTTSVVVEENARATVFGGGLDFPVSDRFSIRVIQADYLTTHQFNVDQHDAKFSTGVVFHMGRLSTRPKHKL